MLEKDGTGGHERQRQDIAEKYPAEKEGLEIARPRFPLREEANLKVHHDKESDPQRKVGHQKQARENLAMRQKPPRIPAMEHGIHIRQERIPTERRDERHHRLHRREASLKEAQREEERHAREDRRLRQMPQARREIPE
ncbi:MAG: hypothetical protein M0R03_13940 [Novosphingobium sp.]|nr:hypothetical protein [Novosphingobium sp.]